MFDGLTPAVRHGHSSWHGIVALTRISASIETVQKSSFVPEGGPGAQVQSGGHVPEDAGQPAGEQAADKHSGILVVADGHGGRDGAEIIVKPTKQPLGAVADIHADVGDEIDP